MSEIDIAPLKQKRCQPQKQTLLSGSYQREKEKSLKHLNKKDYESYNY